MPHCAAVSETVSKIRCSGDSVVTRNVSTSAAPINCRKRRFAIV